MDLSNQVVRILGSTPVKTMTEALEQTGRKARLIGQGIPEGLLVNFLLCHDLNCIFCNAKLSLTTLHALLAPKTNFTRWDFFKVKNVSEINLDTHPHHFSVEFISKSILPKSF